MLNNLFKLQNQSKFFKILCSINLPGLASHSFIIILRRSLLFSWKNNWSKTNSRGNHRHHLYQILCRRTCSLLSLLFYRLILSLSLFLNRNKTTFMTSLWSIQMNFSRFMSRGPKSTKVNSHQQLKPFLCIKSSRKLSSSRELEIKTKTKWDHKTTSGEVCIRKTVASYTQFFKIF